MYNPDHSKDVSYIMMKHLRAQGKKSIPLDEFIARWCNGSTTGSEPVSLGSNPSWAAYGKDEKTLLVSDAVDHDDGPHGREEHRGVAETDS